MEKNEYEDNEKVIYKTTCELRLTNKKPEEVDCLVTEGHVVIKAEEPIKIPLSRMKDCDIRYSVPTIPYSTQPQEVSPSTVVLTFLDDFNKKHSLTLQIADRDLYGFKQAVDKQIAEQTERELEPGVEITSEEAMDKDKANNAIKTAWIAGMVMGVFTLVISLIFGATPVGPLIVIDIFLIFGLSFGVYKKNRACAVILFIYFVFNVISKFIRVAIGEFPLSTVIWQQLTMIFIFGYPIFQGIRGTFAYHRIIKAETNGEKIESESVKKKSKKKPFLIGCGVAAAIVVAIAVGFIIWLWDVPSGGVKMANEMHPYALEYIEEHNLLNDTEALIAYYDVTGQMDGSEAAILTTERVMYHKDGRTEAIDLKDIDDVSIDYFLGHTIEVRSKSEVRIEIYIAHANLGELFYDALMDAWNLQKTR